MKRIRSRISYPVSRVQVTLRITTGEGQRGRSRVFLEGVDIEPETGNLWEIGSGPELLGLTLRVKSVITDISPHTNRTSIGYRLAGGLLDHELFQQATVDHEGDSVIYWLHVDFV